MSTAMYSGVSGLKSQQTKLDVIGNNIANVSTTGYKSQSVSFSDILSQTISSATAPSTTSSRGGTNAQQVGLGVSVSSVSTNMDTGSTESTGSDMDVSIGGDGFFIVQGGTTGDYQFTRAGNFGVDSNGNLTVNGLTVCGWLDYTTNTDGTYTYDTQKTVETINLFSDSYNGNKKVIAPDASGTATITGTLDPSETAQGTGLTTIGSSPTSDSTSTMTVYDAEGNSYDVQVKFSKCYTETVAATAGTASSGTLTVPVTVSSASNNNQFTITVDGGTATTITVADGTYSTLSDLATAVNSALSTAGVTGASAAVSGSQLVFTSTSTGSSSAVALGSVSGNTGLSTLLGTPTTAAGTDAGSGITSWYWQVVSSDSDLTVGTPSTGYVAFNSDGSLVTGDSTYSTTPSITLTPAASVGAAAFSVQLDMSDLTTYTSTSSSGSSVTATADGYASGELEDVSIGSDGVITGTYSNGQKQPLAMLALASFTNPEGLEKIGTNLYVTTVNSGTFTGGVSAGSNGTGTLSSGTLEGSNVDLATEFSNMMITQRAYQANSKIITTSDEMMETLINMKR